MEVLVLIISSGLICGIISSSIASRKGEPIGGFLVGFFFGPLGILVSLLSKGNRKTCPHCKEMVMVDANACPHCQREIIATFKVICPVCGEQYQLPQSGLIGNMECSVCKRTFPITA